MKRGRRNKKSKKRDETKKLYIPNGRKNIKYEVTHLAFEKTEGFPCDENTKKKYCWFTLSRIMRATNSLMETSAVVLISL